jgi:aquaporin Z
MLRRCAGEAIGAMGIVLAGGGALAIAGPRVGLVGVALAFGLAAAAMTLALARVSGAHLNPAVSLAAVLTGRLPARELVPYVASQIAGGTLGAGVVLSIARGRPGGAPPSAWALANGFGRFSPGFYDVASVLACEIALTALVVFVLLGVSGDRMLSPGRVPGALGARAVDEPSRLAAAAGVAYALACLVALPVDGAALNPARALGPAILLGGSALAQTWAFVVGPLAEAVLGALAHRVVCGTEASDEATSARPAPERVSR